MRIVNETSFLIESRKVKQFLEKVIPNEAKQASKVGGAGSFFLFDYDPSLMSVHNTSSPNDVDIFVCAEYGETSEEFTNFVDAVVANAERRGYAITDQRTHSNIYVYKDTPILITDIYVNGIEVHISFVQCPKDREVLTVVDRFDLDIVRVVYDLRRRQTLPRSPAIASAIRSRVLSVIDFTFQYGAPTNFEKRKVLSTLSRMRKFHQRGFEIGNLPRLLKRTIVETRSTRQAIQERELQSIDPTFERRPVGWPTVEAQVLMRTAFRELTAHISPRLKRRARVGAIGFHPFAYVLGSTDEHVINIADRVRENQVVFQTDVPEKTWLDVFICTQGDRESFHTFVRSFISSAYGGRPPPETTLTARYNEHVMGLSPYMETVGINFHKNVGGTAKLNYRFVHLPHPMMVDDLMNKQIFSFYKVKYNIDEAEFEQSPSAIAAFRTGLVECGKFQFELLGPSVSDIKLFSIILDDMQFYFRRGWDFIQYPTLEWGHN